MTGEMRATITSLGLVLVLVGVALTVLAGGRVGARWADEWSPRPEQVWTVDPVPVDPLDGVRWEVAP